MKTIAVAATVLATAALLTACSGDDDSGADASESGEPPKAVRSPTSRAATSRRRPRTPWRASSRSASPAP